MIPDRHGNRHLTDAEAQRLGVQPHPYARQLIAEAAAAAEYFTEDELEAHACSLTQNPRTP